jgi:hypothetical protein
LFRWGKWMRRKYRRRSISSINRWHNEDFGCQSPIKLIIFLVFPFRK